MSVRRERCERNGAAVPFLSHSACSSQGTPPAHYRTRTTSAIREVRRFSTSAHSLKYQVFIIHTTNLPLNAYFDQ